MIPPTSKEAAPLCHAPPTAALPAGSPTDPGATRRPPWAVVLVVVLYLALYFAAQVASSRQRSVTMDEPVHLAAGYAALTEGDFRVDPSHPPLVRMWAALPLLLQPTHLLDLQALDQTNMIEWLGRSSFAVSAGFVTQDGPPDAMLRPARMMVMILGAVLGLLVFCWARELAGFWPAVLALVLYTLEPNLAAHATLVTTDLGVTCFIFGTVYFLWRVRQAWSAANLAGLVLFFALACTTKFSAVALLPIIGILLILESRGTAGLGRRKAWGILALLATTAPLAIWAVYGFRDLPAPSSAGLIGPEERQMIADQMPFSAPIFAWLESWHALPRAFLQGVQLGTITAELVPGFLAGDIESGGRWYYFPFAFLVKTPAALLSLLAAGLLLYCRRPSLPFPSHRAWLLVPISVFVAFAVTSSINIGLRHLLPIYPFVILVAADAGRELLERGRRTGRIVLLAAVAFAVIRTGQAWPHTLSHFNAFVGGSENGYKLLSDSNVDWGQGLKRLRTWMQEADVDRINLAYFGSVDPTVYGINANFLPGSASHLRIGAPELPGYVAISSTILSGVVLPPEFRFFYEGFASSTPAALAGNSIRIYWVDQWPVEPAAPTAPDDSELGDRLNFALLLFSDLSWPDLAVPHFRRYLEHRPDDIDVTGYLAEALFRSGDPAAGVTVLEDLVRRQADPAPLALAAAAMLSMYEQFESAVSFADYAVRLEPDSARGHDFLGFALTQVGRTDEALREFRRSLELDPDFAPAREHLAELQSARP